MAEDDDAELVRLATSPLADADAVIPLGPSHPSAHGALGLSLWVRDQRIVRARAHIGYLHRGAEKLFESRDYRAVLALANRHDWLGSMAGELGVAVTVEAMLGMEVPARARWARVALAELSRAYSHLVFWGSFPLALGRAAPAGFLARERLQALMEEATGGRVHLMVTQVGGLKADLPDGWTDRARSAVADVRDALPAVAAATTADPDVAAAARGTAVVSAAQALAFAASGAVARASGVGPDWRLASGDPTYAELADAGVLRVPRRDTGDALARLEVLAEQTTVALDLAEAALDRLDTLAGPINVRLPKSLRAPEGHCYTATESPLGRYGVLLVSRGGPHPWRLKLATPSFAHLQLAEALLPGLRVDQVAPALASLFFVVGDADR